MKRLTEFRPNPDIELSNLSTAVFTPSTTPKWWTYGFSNTEATLTPFNIYIGSDGDRPHGRGNAYFMLTKSKHSRGWNVKRSSRSWTSPP